MKPTRTFFVFILCCFALPLVVVILPYHARPAYALGEWYAVVSSPNVWLLDSQTSEKLFLLPQSYYAAIERYERGDNYYLVTFNGVSGKVSSVGTNVVCYNDEPRGTAFLLEIHPDFSSFDTLRLEPKPRTSKESCPTVSTKHPLTFLGAYPTDADVVWYYVEAEGARGYVEARLTTSKTLSFPTFVPTITPPQTDPTPTTPEANDPLPPSDSEPNMVLRVVVIVGVSLLLVLVVFLVFRPQKRRRYYDSTPSSS